MELLPICLWLITWELAIPNFTPFLKHYGSEMIMHILLNPGHMSKLCQNTLKRLETKFAFTWVRKYVWGIHIKIPKAYHKEEMKIFLAAQTFSSSVSDVLKYCSETLNSDSFKNCEPKIKQNCMSKYILPNQTIL